MTEPSRIRREKKRVLYEGGGLLVHRLSDGDYQELRFRTEAGVWVLLVPAPELDRAMALLKSAQNPSPGRTDPRQVTWCE